MNPNNVITMKSDLITKIAGLPDTDERLALLAATLDGRTAAAGPVCLRLLGMSQAAKELNVSRPTFWRMVKDGAVRTVELKKGLRRVPESELRRIVEGAK